MIKISKKLLKFTLFILFLFLFLLSFLETQRSGKAELSEIANRIPIYKEYDNILWHILVAGLLVMGMYLAKRFLDRRPRIHTFMAEHIRVFQFAVALLSGIISFLILSGGVRTPIDDQIQVYSAATLFNEGNYINLSKGGYINMYPQQLGYIMYLQIILQLAGNKAVYVVQVINCLLIMGTVYLICCFLNDLTDELIPRIFGSILLLFLLPLYLMGSWVYGDVPFYFFMFLFLHNFIKASKCKGKKNIIGAIVAAVFCLIFRKHALIFLIAVFIVCFISFFEKRKKMYLILGLFSFVLPLLATKGIDRYYSMVSGYEVDGGIPSIAWVTMGTIEDESAPGWFHNYSVPLYYSTDCDRELTAELAFERLGMQMEQFMEDPVYAASFYKRKISTQWNDPFFNTDYLIPVDNGETAEGITVFLLENEEAIRMLLSLIQSIVYFGTFIYICFVSYKDDFAKTLPEMVILGGFLFSIIWEAKSRYVFTYFIIMFPMAAIGWHQLVCRVVPGVMKRISVKIRKGN